MKPILCLLFLCLVISLQAQEKVRVNEIIDCNRFLLKDGRVIRLANIETPSLTDTGRVEKRIVKMIMNYIDEELKGVILRAEFIDTVEADCYRVHLYRKYDLNAININHLFLERGYGYYVADPKTEYSESYFEAVQKAYRENAGIWQYKTMNHPKVRKLDQRFRFSGGLCTYFDDDDEIEKLPLVSAGYRVSKLIPLIENKKGYLSISAGFENILIVMQNIYLGPEIRIKPSVSLSYYMGTMFLPQWGEGEDPLGSYQCVSLVLFVPRGDLELDAVFYTFKNNDRLFRFGLNIAI
jgi:endonuclease YncB( thermonuclease family)